MGLRTRASRRAAHLGLGVPEKQMSARKKVLGIKPLGFGEFLGRAEMHFVFEAPRTGLGEP